MEQQKIIDEINYYKAQAITELLYASGMITFDEYDKDDNEDMDEDLEEVKDEIIQTLEDNAEYDDKNKSLKEESPNTNKIDDIVAQLMEELPDFAQGYRDIIMELGLSKEDFIDMITTENEHQLLKDKNITEDEEKEVYGKIYDTLV